jgi:hypothetical protein
MELLLKVEMYAESWQVGGIRYVGIENLTDGPLL